ACFIHTTGGLSSYFLPLWLPAVIFIGVFGVRALLAAAVLPLAYGAWLLATDAAVVPTGITLLLAGEVPLLLSYVLFSRLAGGKEYSDPTHHINSYGQFSDK